MSFLKLKCYALHVTFRITILPERCVNKKTGQPIDGFLETNMTVAVGSMTCGCAREAAELKEMGCAMKIKYDGPASRHIEWYEQEYTDCINNKDKESYFPGQLRCLPNGNYDTAQCIAQVWVQ